MIEHYFSLFTIDFHPSMLKRRDEPFPQIRQGIMKYLYTNEHWSIKQLADVFGFDRSTINYSINVAPDWSYNKIRGYNETSALIDDIKIELKSECREYRERMLIERFAHRLKERI